VAAHDAATAHLGAPWRMPTKQELDDLNGKCDWTRTTKNGVNGHEVRGKGIYASVSIFLPCAGYSVSTLSAGYGRGTSLYNAGSRGYYWSSVPSSDNGSAWYLSFNSSRHGTDYNYRFYGQSVRPVRGFTE